MRIGLIVDGQAEVASLPKIIRRVETRSMVLDPLFADIQPWAPVGQIVKAVRTSLEILVERRVDTAVILIDLEGRQACPGELATSLSRAVTNEYSDIGIGHFVVVIKHRCFENWLVADTEAFKKIPMRFKLTRSQTKSIAPNRADSCNAYEILQTAAQKRSYHKVSDAVQIMKHADPMRIAANSRSFRHLLRVLGNPQYNDQSARPKLD